MHNATGNFHTSILSEPIYNDFLEVGAGDTMGFMISLMEKMMPVMTRGMTFEEKEEMMEKMMPHMMGEMSFQEKMRIMQKMMPMMMEDIEMEQMPEMMKGMMPTMMAKMDFEKMPMMMEQMLPLMKEQMKAQGIECTEMMPKMMPVCMRIMLKGKTKQQKETLYKKVTTILKKEVTS
jgi:hypothetical protein